MKVFNTIFLVVLILLLVSCFKETERAKRLKDKTHLHKGVDTLKTIQVFEGKRARVVLLPANNTDFLKATDNHATTIMIDTNGVTQDETSISFKLKNGKNKTIKDDVDAGSKDYVHYNWLGFAKDLEGWVIREYFYESTGFCLINEHSGEETRLWGEPTVSNDKRLMFCSSADLHRGLDPNGFQIFDASFSPPKLIFEQELHDWSIGGARWEASNVLVIERNQLDSTLKEKRYYARLKIEVDR